jgi:predicted nucleotidyltransferase
VSRFAPKSISTEDCQRIVSAKLNGILSLCSPCKVFVFGSAARDEMTDHSDVDLALIFENAAELKRARELVFVRAPGDDWPQDLLLYTESEFDRKKSVGGVCQIIFEDGICIYERARE